jgi:hypothetical protein
MFQKYIKISVFVLLSACKSEDFNFPNQPVLSIDKPVEQIKLNGKDSILKITVHYTDGDGDLGLNTSDTLAPFNYGGKFFYNLFIKVYAVNDGIGNRIPIPLSTDTVNFNDRIQNVTPSGKNKSIFGDLVITLRSIPYPGIKPDSMYYTIQLADRSLNLSNTVKTPTMRFEF